MQQSGCSKVSEATNSYEKRLIREIEALEMRISEFREEQLALKRQLLKARQEARALQDVSRKNSANRVMVEERILAALQASEKSVSNNKLFEAARIANFELKPNTFRTYLLRLKEKGLIENPQRGRWRLVKKDAPKE